MEEGVKGEKVKVERGKGDKAGERAGRADGEKGKLGVGVDREQEEGQEGQEGQEEVKGEGRRWGWVDRERWKGTEGAGGGEGGGEGGLGG